MSVGEGHESEYYINIPEDVKSIIIADPFRPQDPHRSQVDWYWFSPGVYMVCSVTIASCLSLLCMIFVKFGLVLLVLPFFSPSFGDKPIIKIEWHKDNPVSPIVFFT